MRIEADVAGDKQVSRDLLRIGSRADNMRPALLKVAELLAASSARRFSQQGPGWAPLAETTLTQRALEGSGSRILDRSGALKGSVSKIGGAGQQLVATDSWLLFGTTVPYAGIHQHGAPHAGIPQRKIFDLDGGARTAIVKTIQRFALTGELL